MRAIQEAVRPQKRLGVKGKGAIGEALDAGVKGAFVPAVFIAQVQLTTAWRPPGKLRVDDAPVIKADIVIAAVKGLIGVQTGGDQSIGGLIACAQRAGEVQGSPHGLEAAQRRLEAAPALELWFFADIARDTAGIRRAIEQRGGAF